MKFRRIPAALLSLALLLGSLLSATAAVSSEEQSQAAAYLVAQGVLIGDQNGDLKLEEPLTRAELAVILARLTVNQEHLHADSQFYSGQCTFPDVPQWARLYVGYCNTNGLMIGYDNGKFGAEDLVTPAAACTVVLRYVEGGQRGWTYDTACDRALSKGLIPAGEEQGSTITRGVMAIMLFRGREENRPVEEEPDQTAPGGRTENPDGSFRPASDGSRYVPQVGDVLRCDDGTNYTITDLDRYENSMFASDPTGPLPSPTCDWSQFPTVSLPPLELRRYQRDTGDTLFVRNLYEIQRMQYTLYNAAGNCPELWENGQLRYTSDGTPYFRLQLGIDDYSGVQFFWPWRENQLTQVFYSNPRADFVVDVWDTYKDGKYLYTEYQIQTR